MCTGCALMDIGDKGYECKVSYKYLLSFSSAGSTDIPWTVSNGNFKYEDVPEDVTYLANDCKNKTFEPFRKTEYCVLTWSSVLYDSCFISGKPIGTFVNGTFTMPAETDYNEGTGGDTYGIAYRNGIRTYTLSFPEKTLSVQGEFFLKNQEANCVGKNCPKGEK